MKGHQPEVIARRRVVAGLDGSPDSLLVLRRGVYAAARPADNERPRAMPKTGKF
jgi:hypothetical protein